jgi:hypothetical protein
MAGTIATFSSTVNCSHQGTATPSGPGHRVRINGEPVVTTDVSYTVASCSFYPPYGNGPCVNGTWTSAARKVMADGFAVVLIDSKGTCTPTGTPLLVAATQGKVLAQ